MWCMVSMSTPHSPQCWKEWRKSVHFLGGDSASGECCMRSGSATKRKMESNLYTREETYLNRDILRVHSETQTRKQNTYIHGRNAHHTNEYIWIDSDGKGGWNWTDCGTCRRFRGMGGRSRFSFSLKDKLSQLPRWNEQRTLYGMVYKTTTTKLTWELCYCTWQCDIPQQTKGQTTNDSNQKKDKEMARRTQHSIQWQRH